MNIYYVEHYTRSSQRGTQETSGEENGDGFRVLGFVPSEHRVSSIKDYRKVCSIRKRIQLVGYRLSPVFPPFHHFPVSQTHVTSLLGEASYWISFHFERETQEKLQESDGGVSPSFSSRESKWDRLLREKRRKRFTHKRRKGNKTVKILFHLSYD